MGGSIVELELFAEIDGVTVEPLHAVADERGRVVELWRASVAGVAEQWNLGVNEPGSLRGLHWHEDTTDRIIVVTGRFLIALADRRMGSPTENLAFVAWFDAETARAVTIPPGVLHGWWSPALSTHVYAMDREWHAGPPLGVRWDDPELALPWPSEVSADLTVSDQDASLPALADAQMPGYRPPRAERIPASA